MPFATNLQRMMLRSRKKPKKPKPTKVPYSLEREYQRILRAYVLKLTDLIRDRVIPALPHLYYQATMHRPGASLQRADAWTDLFTTVIDGVTVEFAKAYTQDEIRTMARRAGVSVNEFNRRAVSDQIGKAIDADVFFSEQWLSGSLDAFVLNNYNLITSLEDRQIGKVNQLVTQGFQAGQRWEEISDAILESFDVTESQADLIARDQVNKLNGELTRLRQTSVGVDKYVWVAVMDERTRDSHRQNDGKTFAWNEPPAETGHPGEDINCRCIAVPVLETDSESDTQED